MQLAYGLTYSAWNGEAHGNDWSRAYSVGGAVIDEFILTVYTNDVLLQFSTLENPNSWGDPIKRRVGETGRDKQAIKGIGQLRVKSLTPGSNGTVDLELYGKLV